MGAELETTTRIPRARMALGTGVGGINNPPPERHQPMVDINMFTPDNLLGRVDLLRRYFGSEGMQLVREFRKGTGILDPRIRSLRASADKHFFEEVAETFGNSHQMSGDESREFYVTSLTAANKAIERFNQALPEKHEIKGMNEVTVFDPSPSSILYYLNSPNIDPRLRFEIERQIALGYIGGAIEARTRNSGLHGEIARIQQVFNMYLYSGDSGSARQITTYAWHHDDTNEVTELIGNEEPATTRRRNMHLKRHVARMRHVARTVGNVSANFDMKDIESSILKAVFKAQKDKEEGNQGLVDIDVAVKDTIRAKMVVEGTEVFSDKRIKRLIGRVTDVLKRAEREGLIGPIESISRKDEKHDDPKKPPFKRLQVKFANIPIPFEIIFYDQKTDINEKYHVGQMQDDGQFDGYAHPLYELQRLGRMVQTIYPDIIFRDEASGEPYIRIEDLIAQQEVTAFALRGEARVFPEK